MGLYETGFSGSLPGFRTGRTIECRQLTGKSSFNQIWLYSFNTALMEHFGNFCSISYVILSAPGAECFLVSLKALLSSCRSNGSFKLFSFSLCATSAVFLWNWFSNNCLWFDSISFLCETKVLLWFLLLLISEKVLANTSAFSSFVSITEPFNLRFLIFVHYEYHLSFFPSAIQFQVL